MAGNRNIRLETIREPASHEKGANIFGYFNAYSYFCSTKTYFMKHMQYQTEGTCSQLIDVTVDDNDVIQQVFFVGGCNGNLQGICRLVTGQKVDDIINRLNGIRCGTKRTSCPDQLCRALEKLKS